jgi:undecaprenyl-diphosphatase
MEKQSNVRKEAAPPGDAGARIIAPPHVRHRRAGLFQAYVLFASVGFVVTAVLAHTVGYFPVDLTFTRSVQTITSPAFAQLMRTVSWIGFIPQVDILGGACLLGLYLSGLRWEAVSGLFAGVGVLLGSAIKLAVARPRPSLDLVHVASQIDSSGFPSGHVLMVTAFYGFMTFLGYTLLKESWQRTGLLIVFSFLIVLMGVSRIYLGHHWFSDVMGAYVLGSLWLMLTIHVYRWGKTRFFVRQPVAPGAESTT